MILTYILSAAILAVVVVGLRLDRRWISLTPLTPLSVVLFGIFTRSVFSPLLLSLGDGYSLGARQDVMIAFRNEVQMMWLLFSLFLVLPYAVWFREKNKKSSESRIAVNQKVLAIFLLFTGLFSFAWIFIGFATGSASRDPEFYSVWVNRFWKPDAVFTAFGRLRDVFYFLAPLGLWKVNNKYIKLSILAIIALNLYLSLQLGGRGVVLIPILEMYFGLFLLRLRKRVMVFSTCAMLVLGLSGSQLLRGNHSMSFGNLSLVTRASDAIVKRESLITTGLSLYGCSDAFNFSEENRSKRGAGWVRSERWLTSWIPSSIRGTAKGSSRDAHIIAEQLENGTPRELAESKDYYSFNCVTLPGDLFWRWRWIGVVFGGLAFGTFYYGITVVWRKLADLNSLSGCLVFCFPASFLTLYPAGSIGETFWLWTWDIQKYIALFVVLRILEYKGLIPFMRRKAE